MFFALPPVNLKSDVSKLLIVLLLQGQLLEGWRSAFFGGDI
jgi:hypothetical protein